MMRCGGGPSPLTASQGKFKEKVANSRPPFGYRGEGPVDSGVNKEEEGERVCCQEEAFVEGRVGKRSTGGY